MGDLWLVNYDVCARLGQETMEAITDRNKEPRSGAAYAKKSASVRVSLTKFTRELEQLRNELTQSALQFRITQREAERRQTSLDQLVTKQRQLELAFKNEDQRSAQRSSLLATTSAFGDEDIYQAGTRSQYNDMDVHQIRQQQRTMIEEQDQGLEALSRVVGRQKQIAIDIGNEVESQNDIIDDITDHVDHTNTRLVRETKHVKLVDKKASGACWMWIVIVLLVITIVIIAVIPYN